MITGLSGAVQNYNEKAMPPLSKLKMLPSPENYLPLHPHLTTFPE
jgi:hypothetical protein